MAIIIGSVEGFVGGGVGAAENTACKLWLRSIVMVIGFVGPMFVPSSSQWLKV
jgi:hypothetical protein